MGYKAYADNEGIYDGPEEQPTYGLAIPLESSPPPKTIEQFQTIKAGYRDYHISFVNEVWLKGKECWGTCDPDKGLVEVKQGLDRQLKAEVLLHELTHIAFDMAGLKRLQEMEEESVVEGISQHMAGLIRDNPLLFKRIVEDLKGG